MKQKLKQYLDLFLLAAAIIVFYKTFDSLHVFIDFLGMILNILTPFIVGAVLAYLLYPLCKQIEKRLAKSSNEKIRERKMSLSVFIAYFTFLIILVILLIYLIPVAINNIVEFANKSGDYLKQFEEMVLHLSKNPEMSKYIQNVFESVDLTKLTPLININVMDYAKGAWNTASTLLSWLMGIVICPYILFERKNLLRIFDQIAGLFVKQKYVDLTHYYGKKVHVIFSNFISGKALDSLIIGIIAYIGFSLLKLKYAFVLALIVMVTNMIPYFGPFIGAVPVVLITVVVMGPVKAIWSALFIFALQQFDGLILGPAILGDSVGIGPFWIIFAITLFGGLFGFIGMFIGVPLIAVIRMFILEGIAFKNKKENKQEVQ